MMKWTNFYMPSLLGFTRIDRFDTLWFDEKFRTFAKFMGFRPIRDSKGVHFGEPREVEEIVKNLELIYAWGKDRAKSEDIEDVIPEVKKLIDGLGTNFIGKELIDLTLKEIRWGKLSEDKKVEPKEEIDEETEKEAQTKISEMQKELKELEHE